MRTGLWRCLSRNPGAREADDLLVPTENRSRSSRQPPDQAGSLRSLGRIRWLMEPDPDVLERTLGLLSALTDDSEHASGRVTPVGWELERTDPAHRVFLQRGGAQHLRVAWFAPSLSITKRVGLRFFRTPAEWHLRWMEEAQEVGLPTPRMVAAGVINTPRPLIGSPRSFLMSLWPPDARTVQQWLRVGPIPDDHRLEVARAILALAHTCHWRNVVGLDFDAHAIFVDPRQRRPLLPDLHALRSAGPLFGPARAAADRRAVDRLCRKILSGTRTSVADLHKQAA